MSLPLCSPPVTWAGNKSPSYFTSRPRWPSCWHRPHSPSGANPNPLKVLSAYCSLGEPLCGLLCLAHVALWNRHKLSLIKLWFREPNIALQNDFATQLRDDKLCPVKDLIWVFSEIQSQAGLPNNSSIIYGGLDDETNGLKGQGLQHTHQGVAGKVHAAEAA